MTPLECQSHFDFQGGAHSETLCRGELSAPGKYLFWELVFDVNKVDTKLNDNSVNLNEYLMKWAQEICHESMRAFPSGRLSEGVYERNADATRQFAVGELLLDGLSMKSVALSVSFKINVFRPRVISHFDVVTRGRVSNLTPLAFAGTTLQLLIMSNTGR